MIEEEVLLEEEEMAMEEEVGMKDNEEADRKVEGKDAPGDIPQKNREKGAEETLHLNEPGIDGGLSLEEGAPPNTTKEEKLASESSEEHERDILLKRLTDHLCGLTTHELRALSTAVLPETSKRLFVNAYPLP